MDADKARKSKQQQKHPSSSKSSVAVGSRTLRNYLQHAMGLSSTLYNAILKRTSTYALALVTSAFIFERTFDMGTEMIFERVNEGKLWKHIKSQYEQ